MVQGGLLTAHTGGIQGYGWSLGGVPEQLLQAAPILKRRRQRNREGFAKKGSVLGVSTPRGKYRRRGCRGTHEAARRVPGAAQGGAAPGTLLAPWWWPRSPLLVIPEASHTLIFYIFFLEFFGRFKKPENMKNKNSRKQELTTGCTELVG